MRGCPDLSSWGMLEHLESLVETEGTFDAGQTPGVAVRQ
jgi:hypothetical protein